MNEKTDYYIATVASYKFKSRSIMQIIEASLSTTVHVHTSCIVQYADTHRLHSQAICNKEPIHVHL